MSQAFDNLTERIGREDLPAMVLDKEELPQELKGFALSKEGPLENETMAEHGFPGSTTGEIVATGRTTGYLREFANTFEIENLGDGTNLMAATVVHLFEDRGAVSRWMKDRFVGEFQRYVGREMGRQQYLIAADPVELAGFSDESVGLRTLQATDAGPVSSTIVDFRVGRLLGVAYVVAIGDVERKQLAQQLGLDLEQNILKVVLGAV